MADKIEDDPSNVTRESLSFCTRTVLSRRALLLGTTKELPLDQSVNIDFQHDFLGISMLEQPNKYYFIIRGH
ncbi:hypothetical protein JHK84_050340 [Glycine max]|nr:hypothetical protein JHK84_050340 [Glycine max]